MSQFYIRLPSDSSMNIYPYNTVAHFNTKLVERIHLDEEYNVALTEIIYPNKRMNFYGDMRIHICDHCPQQLTTHDYKFEHGYFDNVEALLTYLNQCLQKLCIRTSFEYDEELKKIIINTNLSSTEVRYSTVRMSDDLKDYLGFNDNGPETVIRHVAEQTFNLKGGMHMMYIYSDIVSYSLVGDTKTPLLKVCNMSAEEKGNELCITFTNPQYIPVARRDFETIEININNELGQPVPFMFGKSVITLDFRRRNTLSL